MSVTVLPSHYRERVLSQVMCHGACAGVEFHGSFSWIGQRSVEGCDGGCKDHRRQDQPAQVHGHGKVHRSTVWWPRDGRGEHLLQARWSGHAGHHQEQGGEA